MSSFMAMKIPFEALILLVSLQLSSEFFERHSTEIVLVPAGLSNPYKMEVSNCSYKILNGFLKEQCLINNEWYFKCSNSYRFYKVQTASCDHMEFNRVCPNDTTFYQACGHRRCSRGNGRLDKRAGLHTSSFGPEVAACGELICQADDPFKDHDSTYKLPSRFQDNPDLLFYRSGETLSSSKIQIAIDCNSKDSFCMNSISGSPVDKYACDQWSKQKPSNTSFHPNLGNFHQSLLCNNFCDSNFNFNCEDEAFCNNLTIGLYCKSPHVYWRDASIYVPPNRICDGNRDCFSNIDEKDCKSFNETCQTSNFNLLQINGINFNSNSTVPRFLSPRSKCSVPALMKQWLICDDYKDQMNCTGSTISPMVCNVDGYPTTISEHVICQDSGLGLCDDRIDDQCVQAETGCKIHKHKLCDGIEDCRMGYDEGNSFCKDAFSRPSMYCVRKLSRDNLERRLPNRWVLDGVTDCRNNLDEDPDSWKKLCGSGILDFYLYHEDEDENCNKVTELKCPLSPKRIKLDILCSGNSMDNCDAKVCTIARKGFKEYINDRLGVHARSESGAKRTFYCLPGLREIEMYAGTCSEVKIVQRGHVHGVPDMSALTSKTFTDSHVKCTEVFGELCLPGMCRILW